MSGKRNQKLDADNTIRILKNLPVTTIGSKNWLGHSSEACKKIDKMLMLEKF